MLSRIVEWDSECNGAELHEKLGKALADHVRIARGDAKAPVDLERLKTARPRLVEEVKLLRRLLKGRFTQQRSLNEDEIRSTAAQLITGPEHRFFHRTENVAIVLKFDERPEDNNKADPRLSQAGPRLSGLVLNTTTPAAFVDFLLAWSTNRSPEALRQALTKL